MKKEGTKKFYIHAGAPKTGMTSIQKSMYINREWLEARGIFYPYTYNPDGTINPDIFNHVHLSLDIAKKIPEETYANQLSSFTRSDILKQTALFINDIRSCKMDILFSSERIFYFSEEELFCLKKRIADAFKESIEFQIIIYLRNPVYWYESIVQQRLKSEIDEEEWIIDELIKQGGLFKTTIEKFSKVFGGSNITISSFEQETINPSGIVAGFLKKIYIDISANDQFEIVRDNIRFSKEALDIIDYIHQHTPLLRNGKVNTEEGRVEGDTNFLSTVGKTKFVLSSEKKKEILLCMKDDIQWLEINFGIDYRRTVIFDHANQEKQSTDKTSLLLQFLFVRNEISATIKNLITAYFLCDVQKILLSEFDRNEFEKLLKVFNPNHFIEAEENQIAEMTDLLLIEICSDSYKEREKLKKKLCTVQERLDIIKNSNIWTYSKPIRDILDRIKRFVSKIKKEQSDNREKKNNHKIDVESRVVDNTEEALNVFVSVIIPTYNAGLAFDELLISLKNQKKIARIQIVIVDSGSKDDTVDVCLKRGVKLIQIKNEVFSHSYARNLGAQNADGDYLLFVTQDIQIDSENWLNSMVSTMLKNNAVAASSLEQGRPDAELYAKVSVYLHNYFVNEENEDRVNKKRKLISSDGLRRQAQLTDTNLLIRKDIFLEYKYSGDYAEDLRLGINLYHDKYRLMTIASTHIIHSHNRSAYYHFRRAFVENVSLLSIIKQKKPKYLSLSILIGDIKEAYNKILYYCNELLISAIENDKVEISEYLLSFRKTFQNIPKQDFSHISEPEMNMVIETLCQISSPNIETMQNNVIVENTAHYSAECLVSIINDEEKGINKVSKKEVVDAIYKNLCTFIGAELGKYYFYHHEDKDDINDMLSTFFTGI